MMKINYRSFIFVAFSIACASALSMIGGIGLEYVSDKILPIIPLLIVIPSLNDLVGDYASIIAAHYGNPEESDRTKKEILKAIFKVVGVNIIFILALSLILASLRGYVLEMSFLLKFVLFISASVVLAIFAMFSLSGFLQLILKRKHINPDVLLIPVVTSLADVIMLLFVALSVVTIFS